MASNNYKKESPVEYDMKKCYFLGRGDLVSSARNKPLSEIKLHHVLSCVMDSRARENAHLVIVKVTSAQSVTLKDIMEPSSRK